MATQEEYKELLVEIIKKQMAILGPDIAILKAQQVEGLKIGKDGSVQSISGDEQQILQLLIDKYIQLSGEIVKNILGPVFAKYPSISVTIK